jgi:predicted phosphohydrolase
MSASRRVVCISDTHLQCRDVPIPTGDILIHAGDLTGRGSLAELAREVDWVRTLPHAHKVLIAGNHDFCFERENERARALCAGLTYLQDEEARVDGLRIWGSPWQPWFFDWAFNLARGAEIRAKWELIPAGIDILVTHGPPLGFGDRTTNGEDVGCADLLSAVRRLKPRYHVYGHIHEGWGVRESEGTTFVNACLCDHEYRPVQQPIVLDL